MNTKISAQQNTVNIPANITEIYLIRHGETTLAATGQYIGSSEAPLSEHGKQQVQLLADTLKSIHFNACYCSIMKRCQATAKILAAPHHLEVIPVAELREIDYGKWEHLTLAEMEASYPELYTSWQAGAGSVRAPQGESGEDVLRRIRPAIEKIVSDHSGQRILLTAHKTVNRIWLCHILGYPVSSYRQSIPQDFTAVNILQYSRMNDSSSETSSATSAFQVKLLNDTSHLQGKEQKIHTSEK